MSLLDDYQLLEIPTTANEQEAKTAFRRLARRYHPDKNPDTDTTAIFQQLQAAYENVQGAIRLGEQVVDWQPFSFTKETAHSSGAKNRYAHTSSATDKEQEAFIKERQRAYNDMKRNNAYQEKTRAEAIKAARNTLNEKRIRALYEEAFKSSKNFTTQGYQYTDTDVQNSTDIPPYHSFVDDEQTEIPTPPVNYSIQFNAAKAIFKVTTYLACFAAGIYATLYWQSDQSAQRDSMTNSHYVSGLYPQYRIGNGYTINTTILYAEPDTNSAPIQTITPMSEMQTIKILGDWLTVRYQGNNGWVQAKNIGYGSALNAQKTGCLGQPGLAPEHGQLMGQANSSSRLRILNQLPEHSLLTFESYDGRAPFSIYLYNKQAYAANYIPKGNYRLVLETGSLYHHECNKFLFNDTTQVILDNVDFASTEQSLTLTP
ncbi:J domain-containing protein [Marinomonas sp. IMCC 4694]|uniref:J domain-containing protein n=1 Tax=Marinomonas sp. IMCC 4694 TaxID=2605432 RepID=UPI0011E6B2BA|nr:J domain-containing protein [Marinomonas sp. IMCC 4694]TYL49438.1 DnaJ domain-containing protein [Marinomonas sp. IMCC 4694]